MLDHDALVLSAHVQVIEEHHRYAAAPRCVIAAVAGLDNLAAIQADARVHVVPVLSNLCEQFDRSDGQDSQQ